jgi:O-antigen/teichoic acid export membrane protein
MSFRKNVLANYASQLYATVLGIVMVPVYLRFLGSEAYGLVGFFSMLQAWFLLLDLGLTPTLARETARYVGGATTATAIRYLLRKLEQIFLVLGVVVAAALIGFADEIASGWLNVGKLPMHKVSQAVVFMALIIAMRWMAGLYRGIITGFERLVWFSLFNILSATARFVLVIPFLIYVSIDPVDFFKYQFVVALIELVVLPWYAYRLLATTKVTANDTSTANPLRQVLGFSLSVAFTSSVWVFVTQTDKLILSKLLPLSEYGYFTLAVLLAGGVNVISGPIAGALMPRLAKVVAEGNDSEVIRLYRRSSQLAAAVAVPASLMLAFFSEQVLLAWTGDAGLASRVAPVLRLYALGNGLLALSAFPYYLQYAKGDLKLHMIGNVLFIVFLIPGLIWATKTFGMTGAGYAWLLMNALYFLFWVPHVHRRFFPGLHMYWLLQDILPIAALTTAVAFLQLYLVNWPGNRVFLIVTLGVLGVALMAAAALGTTPVRDMLSARLQRRLPDTTG